MKPFCLALAEEGGTVVVTADAANLIPSTNCRPRMYCNPYCNRADTHWYTMDKVMPPDHQKPPKQAELPDA
jgi:hypothetical protein